MYKLTKEEEDYIYTRKSIEKKINELKKQNTNSGVIVNVLLNYIKILSENLENITNSNNIDIERLYYNLEMYNFVNLLLDEALLNNDDYINYLKQKFN